MLVNFAKRHPDFTLTVFGIIAALALLAVAEGGMRLFWRPSKNVVRSEFQPKPKMRELSILSPPANGTMHGISRNDSTVFYSYDATIDGHHRRVTTCPEGRDAGCFTLFFGCSFTFGEGLSDAETIPSRFCALAPGVEVLNYAFGGYGVQQAWLHLQRPKFREEVRSPSGLAFYVFIDNHLERLRGNVFWKSSVPRLEERNGKVALNGTFVPLTASEKLWDAIDTLRLGRLFHEEFFPLPRPSRKEAEFLALICGSAKEKMRSLFPGSDLRVIIFPYQQCGPLVSAALDRQGVRCLDYSALLSDSGVSYEESHFPDSHPSAAAAGMVAARLAADLAADPEWGPKLGLTPAAAP